jgi:hypothetical protein
VEELEFCLFLVVFPARCISSISQEFTVGSMLSASSLWSPFWNLPAFLESLEIFQVWFPTFAHGCLKLCTSHNTFMYLQLQALFTMLKFLQKMSLCFAPMNMISVTSVNA